MKKLYGKELDDELAKRKQFKEERIEKRITLRQAANTHPNMKPSEYIEWEAGHDICPHEEWQDVIGGVPFPKFILKSCKKCGFVDMKSTEKINEKNMERSFKAFKASVRQRLKEDKK